MNTPAANGQCRGPEGIDESVLTARGEFLRPDSLLAIILLSDEDDCSIVDSWQNYIALQAHAGSGAFHLPRATSICASDPADPACMSCVQGDHPDDPKCKLGVYDDLDDNLNLRCYRQKQRFGVDFLYPVQRYVNGLTKKQFSPQDLEFNPGFAPDKDFNPLFCTRYGTQKDGVTPDRSICNHVVRDPSLVFFAAIVGVPWQDLANDPNDLKKGYRPAEELGWTKAQFDAENKKRDPSRQRPIPPGVTDAVTVWDQILGRVISDPKNPANAEIDWSPASEPLDPLMIESIEPRTGINPATGKPLAPPSSNSPDDNPVNGHEWDIAARDDLQFACTFPLPKPRDCTGNSSSCDCAQGKETNNPVCQSPTGVYGTMQARGKAYPGRRHLAVLHGLDPNQAIAASVCPTNVTDPTAADYGYRPAINSIVDRLGSAFSTECQFQALDYQPDGTVACRVMEAARYPQGETQCPACESMDWRTTPPAGVVAALEQDSNYLENNLKCVCEIPQARVGAELTACIESTDEAPGVDGQPVNGWCYVDPSGHPGANEKIVRLCGAEGRTIRFLGDGEPHPGTLTFLLCTSLK